METFFKPVHSPPSLDEIKLRKNHQRQYFHHQQNTNRYSKLDDSDRNTDDSQGHHRYHSRYHSESPHHDVHYPLPFQHSEDSEKPYNRHPAVNLPSASSSSLSSSSSTCSSSSWFTEASAKDPFSLHHAERPQHSLSCSNIPDVPRGFKEDSSNGPIVFATVKHGKKENPVSRLLQSEKQDFASLHRGHSRSDEGLLQVKKGGKQSRASHNDYGPLYKTASLNRSLAFSEEDIVLGVSKRAVSSTQLPSKGILKNKDPQTDIRKSKSMEVLSPRVTKGEGQSGQKGKGVTQAEIERARASFVEGKLQFSAFLDDITKQVMSPSNLSILGVSSDKTARKTTPPEVASNLSKPQLPPKKHRRSTAFEKELPIKHPNWEVRSDTGSRRSSDTFNPGKISSHTPGASARLVSSGARRERRSSPGRSYTLGERYGKYDHHLTDGTSTSPEPRQPKQRHHRRSQPESLYSQQSYILDFSQRMQKESENIGPRHSPPPSAQGVGPGFGSESSSTKSDSSRARDTASTSASHSSEQSGQYHSQHVSKKQKDILFDSTQLEALQDENADLHQNLLQTVVCIESLEAELQRTRDELGHVKDKYKSLMQTHTGTKQANNVLGEHLHVASESLSSERKYLFTRVSQLSSELEDAHRTIAALESINVPCLIKELLEKHFGSAEAIQKFLVSSTLNHSQPSDNQPHSERDDSVASDWLTKSEAGAQRPTAFVPIKQRMPAKEDKGGLTDQKQPSLDPLLSVAEISSAIYKKISSNYAARPQPVYPQTKPKISLSINHADAPASLQEAHGGENSWADKCALKVPLFDHDAENVSSASAQQILDDFMQHLHTHREGTEPPGSKE